MKFDNVTIQIRHDTANNWLNKNPVLKAGEAGYDITNSVFKIGDGTTHWNDLASIQGGQGGDETDVKIITFVTADWKKDSNNNHVLTINTGYKNNKFIANLEILKDDKKTYYSSVEEFSVSDSGIITVTNNVAPYSGRFVTAKFVSVEEVTDLTTKVADNTNEITTLKTNKADKTELTQYAKLDDINTFTAVNNFHEINCKGLSCGNKRVSGVADPLISSDAINKQTFDAGLAKKADLTGATFSGEIKQNSNTYNAVYMGSIKDIHISTATMNSMKTGYVYYAQAYDKSVSNTPPGANGGLVEYVNYGYRYIHVKYYSIGGNSVGEIFLKAYNGYGKTWSDWHKITHAGDLEKYLALTGGTITGDINYKKAELRYNSLFYTPLVNDLNTIDLTSVPSGTSIHAFCASTCKGLPKDYFKGTVKITCYTHGEDWATEELLPIVAVDAGKRAQRVWAKASGWSEWYLFNGTANTAGNIT